MASARARLGKARRGIIKRKKQTGVVTGALSALGTVAAFGAGQVKKAETAWKEYEAGYEELGGEDFERPKIGKGYFKGPEGDVRIGASIYDRSKIQEAGSFLGSDAAAILDDTARSKYLERTAPGRDMTGEEVSTTRESLRPKMPFTGGEYDVETASTTESPQEGQREGAMRPYYHSPIIPASTVGQDWQTPLPLGKSEPFQETEAGGYGVDPNPRGPNLGSMWSKFQRGPLKSAKNILKQQFTEGPEYGQALPWDQQVVPKEKDISAEPTSGPPLPKWFPSLSFARGGDFITNGPQKILVGDNPGGRERVTVKPLSSKNDAEFGRYGDDSMKIIDGQPAHIDSSIEGDMSPEDIKKYGAGTINPITGKKEYFLPMVMAGLAIGSSLYKGYQATQNRGDVQAGQTAAYDIQQEQLDFLGDVRTQTVTGATQQAELGFDVTQSQLAAGGRESTMGARTAISGVQAGTTSAISQSNLATSGTIQQKAQIGAGDVTAKLKSDMTKIFETIELAGRERDLTISTVKEKADLAYRSGEMSAEEAYESTLTGLESIPGRSEGYQHPLGRFLEGALG